MVILSLSGSGWSQGREWSEVESFAYQLQNLEVERVHQSPFDLIICDYSLHGDDESRLTREQLHRLKTKPDGSRRYVLAYFSIGEAEDYRYYWQPSFRPGEPDWLMGANPAWPDNYPVKYWTPQWRQVLFSYLDRILEAGFDGVYLDKVDAYETFPQRTSAKSEMSELVQELARYGRQRGGEDFGVFPQNGEELLGQPGYLDVITGIGREDTYYGYPDDSAPSPPEWTREIEGWLQKAVEAEKLVLNVDYTDSVEQAAQARRRALKNGYLEYVAGRELARLELEEELSEPSRPREDRWPAVLLILLALLFLAWMIKRRR